jgi:hypothetical protein
MTGKRVQFDPETWASVDLLAKDRMMTFQELADEAFRDILRKYDRPFSLKEALRKSAGISADIVPLRKNEQAGKAPNKTGNKTRKKSYKKRL